MWPPPAPLPVCPPSPGAAAAPPTLAVRARGGECKGQLSRALGNSVPLVVLSLVLGLPLPGQSLPLRKGRHQPLSRWAVLGGGRVAKDTGQELGLLGRAGGWRGGSWSMTPRPQGPGHEGYGWGPWWASLKCARAHNWARHRAPHPRPMGHLAGPPPLVGVTSPDCEAETRQGQGGPRVGPRADPEAVRAEKDRERPRAQEDPARVQQGSWPEEGHRGAWKTRASLGFT